MLNGDTTAGIYNQFLHRRTAEDVELVQAAISDARIRAGESTGAQSPANRFGQAEFTIVDYRGAGHKMFTGTYSSTQSDVALANHIRGECSGFYKSTGVITDVDFFAVGPNNFTSTSLVLAVLIPEP